MEQAAVAPLKKTPLHARHRALGREDGSVRRLGHAGRVFRHHRRASGGARARRTVRRQPHGRDRDRRQATPLAAVQRISCNDASKLEVGQAQYSGLHDAATARSSTICSSTALRREHFLLVVNASHIADDYAYIAERDRAVRRRGGVRRELALRADRDAGAARARDPAAADRRRSRRRSSTTGSRHGEVAGVRATISRTGYTGEDGFEIFVPPQLRPTASGWR